MLQRDYDRHRRWLVIDTLWPDSSSAVLMLVPGPNILAYYFAFRVVGHWLSMRGAAQGLQRVDWTGRPCPPLSELRDADTLEPTVRDARIHDVAARLRLQHLSHVLRARRHSARLTLDCWAVDSSSLREATRAGRTARLPPRGRRRHRDHRASPASRTPSRATSPFSPTRNTNRRWRGRAPRR